MKNITCIFIYLLFILNIIEAQVTIGSTAAPMPGALLELKMENSMTKGLGLPRVKLLSSKTLQPCADESIDNNADKHIGLLVYNMAKVADVCPGIFIWTGAQWQSLSGPCENPHIQFDQAFAAIQRGNTQAIPTTLYLDDGKIRNYAWTSSDPSVATINANTGQLTAVADGVTTVTVKSDDNELEATCKIFVIDPAQGLKYKFRFHLTDKFGSDNDASTFLTAKAIARRNRQGIVVDFSDQPISPIHRKSIIDKGGIIVAQSKWMNTLAVHVETVQTANDLLSLPCVKDVELAWRGASSNRSMGKLKSEPDASTTFPMPYANSNDYGNSWVNINTGGGEILHDAGYRGAGIEIAILDGGFQSFNNIEYFSNANVKEIKSFVRGISDAEITTNNGNYYHGTEVFSCLGTNKTGTFVGTAPEASYRLFMTEDPVGDDYPIEEDYMVAAMEYADSLGVDMLNISLGYPSFGPGSINHSYATSDGNTAHSTKGANWAVKKGMLVVTSAGNSGGGAFIEPPSDSPLALVVGAIMSDNTIWNNSSYGTTSGGVMRPDVVALGYKPYVISGGGVINNTHSGTSFSSPIMCGMVACLWGAYPNLTSLELLDIIKSSSDRYANPTLPYGYGKPDWTLAMKKAQGISGDFVKLDKSTAELGVNEQIVLQPTFSSQSVSQKSFEWTVDKQDVVKLEENADKSVKVTALNIGEVKIKIEATDKSISDSCLIKISRNSSDIVRVLAIGNSFTVNAMNDHFYKLATSGGKKVVIARLTKGGETLQGHLNNANSNSKTYSYWKTDENGTQTSSESKTMEEVLKDEEWDYISFQQQSERGDEYDQCAPYIPGLVAYAKNKSTNPGAQYIWFQYWPFALDYTWNDFDEKHDRDQLKMLAALVDVGDRCSKLVDPNMLIFPFGTTVQNVRSSSVGDNMCADGYHLNSYGCFTVSCTWYESIFGDVINNPYKPSGISDKDIKISKYAAKYAIDKPDAVTEMTDFTD